MLTTRFGHLVMVVEIKDKNLIKIIYVGRRSICSRVRVTLYPQWKESADVNDVRRIPPLLRFGQIQIQHCAPISTPS